MFFYTLKIISLTALLGSVQCLPSSKKDGCECFLFMKDDHNLPKYKVISPQNDLMLSCTDQQEAKLTCKQYCSEELSTLNMLYSIDPSVLDGYPPSQRLPCHSKPAPIASFYTFCGLKTLELSTDELGPPVCCIEPTRKINWCGSTEYLEYASIGNSIEPRELNLEVDPNDESQNEILGTSLLGETKKGNKTKNLKPDSLSTLPSPTFVQRVIKYFGYKSIGDAIKNIDIFSLPRKVQDAIKKYRDEVGMGRCYMEFTTFKLFTKQENPFEGLLRRKRETSPSDEDSLIDLLGGLVSNFTPESFEGFFGEFGKMFDNSESGRQYANIMKMFLPVLTQALTGGQQAPPSQSSSGITSLLRIAGPLMLQMANSRPTSVHDKLLNNNNMNSLRPLPAKHTQRPVSSAATSPINSIVMTLAESLLSNMFKTPAQNSIATSAPMFNKPSNFQPQVSQASSPGIPSLSSLLKLFLGGVSSSRPSPTSRPISKPVTVKQKETEEKKREEDEKRFIGMVLELIRPVFISILGSAPGESGVKAIRKASTLSTLGRVDNNQRDEVNSPMFCFKRYMVNKAWTVTETGVRTFLSKFTPEERHRMMERML